MMKHALLVALFLLPGLTHAVICKTVDAEGVVAYADVPADECRTRVTLPEYSRYAPRPVRETDTSGASGVGAKQVEFSGYRELRIVKPEGGEEIPGDQGRVLLALALDPELRPGHRIHVYLDGALILGSFDGTEIELSGVDPGSHEVRVVVLDGDGEPMIASVSVRFTLQGSGQVETETGPSSG